MLKPIFELITGEYKLFDNIIYNYIAMGIVGTIAYKIAKKTVRLLYKDDVIIGSGMGSLAHWTIRTIVFLIVFYIFSGIIWATKFVYTYRFKILSCLIIIAVTFIIIKLIKRNKKKDAYEKSS